MIKKILVPIDYSEASLNAVETAISIARSNNSVLQILHVSETGNKIDNKSQNESRAQYVFDAMAGNILKKHGVGTEVIFAEGIAGEVIVRSVYEKKPDMVIMGAHGASGKRDSNIGSNSYFVIKNADCPVLIIPGDGKWTGFEKILYPVRPDQGKLKRFDIVKDIASGKNCFFEIFAILLKKQTNDAALISNIVTEMEGQAPGTDHIKLTLSYSSDKKIDDEVLDKVTEINADLLVVSATLDASGSGHFIGPCSQRIINRAKIPQLTMLKSSVPALIA